MEKSYGVFRKLKGLRAERGLSQSDMAKIAGIGEDSYRKKENGERDFKLGEISKIADALEISPMEYFFYSLSSQKVTKDKQLA